MSWDLVCVCSQKNFPIKMEWPILLEHEQKT